MGELVETAGTGSSENEFRTFRINERIKISDSEESSSDQEDFKETQARYLNINHAVMRESQAGRTSKNQPVNSPLNATVSFYNNVFKQMQDQMEYSRHLKGFPAELQSMILQKWFEKVKNSNVLPEKSTTIELQPAVRN